MQIEGIKLSRLHNGEHFQFHTTFRDLVKAAGPAALKIEPLWGPWQAVYARLDEALKKIMKSEHTARIDELDRARDEVFRGLADTARGALHHFNPAAREAAGRLAIVLDTYGNVAKMTLDDETAMIYNLLAQRAGRAKAKKEHEKEAAASAAPKSN